MVSRKLVINAMIVSAIFLAGCSSDGTGEFEEVFNGEIEHVHGMGYAGGNDGLYLATHGGLKIFRDGGWHETTRNYNDYMGFNAVDEGFYTSGHPGGDSDIPNPFGIQRSFDGGRTLEHIQFEGETDYHAMAVGYDSHDIFLLNPEPNSALGRGFYKSTDDGESWEQADAEGLQGGVLSLAIHPSDSNFVAAATSTGIYLSEDGGNQFKALTDPREAGMTVYFYGDDLYYAINNENVELYRRDVKNDEEAIIDTPKLENDGIAYIARNRQNEKELAIYTVNGDVYVSDAGSTAWEKVLNEGQTR